MLEAGSPSVLQPLLFANGDPYPPIAVVEIAVGAVAGIAASLGVVGKAGAVDRASYHCGSGRRGKIAGVRPQNAAGETPVPECADDSKQLVVSKSRIRRCLDDNVRRFVHGIARGINEVE